MPDFEMEINACQEVRMKMQDISSAIQDSLDRLSRKVGDAIGVDWEADSAYEFDLEYQSLRTALQKRIDELNELADALDKQIKLAIQVDSGFG